MHYNHKKQEKRPRKTQLGSTITCMNKAYVLSSLKQQAMDKVREDTK